jgi:transposase-like protein
MNCPACRDEMRGVTTLEMPNEPIRFVIWSCANCETTFSDADMETDDEPTPPPAPPPPPSNFL